MIPFYEYQFITQGIKRWDFQDSRIGTKDRYWGELAYVYGKEVAGGIKFQDYIHTFVLKDIPAFKDESYITSRQDYIIKMDFQLSEAAKAFKKRVNQYQTG